MVLPAGRHLQLIGFGFWPQKNNQPQKQKQCAVNSAGKGKPQTGRRGLGPHSFLRNSCKVCCKVCKLFCPGQIHRIPLNPVSGNHEKKFRAFLYIDYGQRKKLWKKWKTLYIPMHIICRVTKKGIKSNGMEIVGSVFILAMLILRFTPNEKIKVMGDFFKKVLPRLPLSEMIKSLKGKS